MDWYTLVKTLHILSAAVLFGTGLGIAFFMFVGLRSPILSHRVFAARATVVADFCFTLPAVIIQPLSGAYLILKGGFSWNASWLLGGYALYFLAGLCWIPVIFIQLRLHNLLQASENEDAFSELEFNRLFRIWFLLGWPAFLSVVAIFWLMVWKPS